MADPAGSFGSDEPSSRCLKQSSVMLSQASVSVDTTFRRVYTDNTDNHTAANYGRPIYQVPAFMSQTLYRGFIPRLDSVGTEVPCRPMTGPFPNREYANNLD